MSAHVNELGRQHDETSQQHADRLLEAKRNGADMGGMAALAKAIENASSALGGIAATLSIIHENVVDQPALCDALCLIEQVASDPAEKLDMAGHAAGLTV